MCLTYKHLKVLSGTIQKLHGEHQFSTRHIDVVAVILPGPTLLLTSDIIKQRLGAAALDRCVLLQECCMYILFSPPLNKLDGLKQS